MIIRKGTAFFILSLLFILLSGCETIRSSFQGATGGANKDWEVIKRADDWIRKNLW